ncbi:squalene/phytoene synthase family protein [Palleronia sp. KMU-117]|uniref:squalene/phytoene synthase family protein n=1 Tax=Palleronia sp. KMU-117 TaxID=3434108 RepID=UPI003D709BDE
MSLDACADLVQRGDPDRFATVLAAPVGLRARLLPLYAFNVEVTRAPWVTAEAPIAEMRLQWWRDALEEVAQGRPVRRHEVTTPLAGVIDAEAARTLDRLVAARRWDIYRDPFEDAAHFAEYIDATAAGLMWTAARLLGAGDEAAVRDLGWAQGLAAFLRAIPELESRGRRPLVDGRPEAVAALAAEGLRRLRAGVAGGARGPATWPAWEAAAVLALAARDPGRVAEGALGVSELRRRALRLRAALTGRVAA